MPQLYRPPAGVLFPYGHIVADVTPAHVKHLFAVPAISRFRTGLDSLCRRWRPLSLSSLPELPHNRKNGSPHSFLLSFDDGMREVRDVIAPMLREKGIPAIFFVNTSTIDNQQLMWRHKVSLLIERAKHQRAVPPQLNVRSGESVAAKLHALRFADLDTIDAIARFYEVDFDEYLARTTPYLTSSDILELTRQGFEVGSHSETHPYFNTLAIREQERQISASVEFLRALGVPCRCFAFPFHDAGVPRSVFSHMKELQVLLSFGTSEARVDPVAFSFQRFALDAHNAESTVPEILGQLSAKSLGRRISRTELIKRD